MIQFTIDHTKRFYDYFAFSHKRLAFICSMSIASLKITLSKMLEIVENSFSILACSWPTSFIFLPLSRAASVFMFFDRTNMWHFHLPFTASSIKLQTKPTSELNFVTSFLRKWSICSLFIERPLGHSRHFNRQIFLIIDDRFLGCSCYYYFPTKSSNQS